jgi:hypothetical protein
MQLEGEAGLSILDPCDAARKLLSLWTGSVQIGDTIAGTQSRS